MKLSEGDSILEIEENKSAIQQIKKSRPLNPKQLLKIAKWHYGTPDLSIHLASVAMRMIVSSKPINEAMEKIGDAKVEGTS